MADTYDFRYLKSVVARRIGTNAMDHMVEDALNEVFQDITSRGTFKFMTSVQSVTADSRTLDIPSDVDTIYAIWDDTNQRWLDALTDFEFFEKFGPEGDSTTGNPALYTVVEADGSIYFEPAPTSVTELSILCTLKHSLLDDDKDVPKVPQKWMSVCVQGATSIVKSYQDRNNRVELQLYEAGIARMMAKDGILKGIRRRMMDQFTRKGRGRGPLWKSGGYTY